VWFLFDGLLIKVWNKRSNQQAIGISLATYIDLAWAQTSGSYFTARLLSSKSALTQSHSKKKESLSAKAHRTTTSMNDPRNT
jgi:hypothetical protein